MVLLKITKQFDYRVDRNHTIVYREGEIEVEDHVAQVCLAQGAGEIIEELEEDGTFDEEFELETYNDEDGDDAE